MSGPAHAWTPGAALPALDVAGAVVVGALLACCSHCETTRVVELQRPGVGTFYLCRAATEDARVVVDEPPCIPPVSRFRAPW